MSPARQLVLLASMIVSFLAGSSAPTPLYPVYRAAWHFTPVAVTVVFGIYALAVLAMLLVTGSVSDHVGRRPVLIVAALMQAVTMLVFATAHGLTALLVARVVQGLATGVAASAIGAGMLDLDRAKGTLANAVAPMTGTATGALGAGLLVQYAPSPTVLVYALLGVVFVLQAIAVVRMRETAPLVREPGRRERVLASLRPQFRLPARVRGPMLAAVPALIAAWALAGFYGSLGPALVRQMCATTSLALGGISLAVLAASGALTVFVLAKREARATMRYGAVALVIGVALTLVAMAQGAASVFFAGSVIAGSGFGAAFQGAIRSVLPLAEADERAGVLSVVYVIAYLAMGVPAIAGGLRVVHGGGIMTTAREYGLAVIVLAAFALAGTLVPRGRLTAVTSLTEP
jgi:predicted MFS family arabinose efflux permease